jgi:hypothetical protein
MSRDITVVELRGFEPLTFSNGQADGIARSPSVDLESTCWVFNPAADRIV